MSAINHCASATHRGPPRRPMPRPRRPAPAVPTDPPALSAPRSIHDLINDQLHLIEAVNASNVTRICEGEFGITRREWRFVALLSTLGPLAPSQLAEQSGLDRSRTSKALMPLLDKGLVTRAVDPHDGRRATVSLTAEGEALYRKLFPRVVEINVRLLDVLRPAEIRVLAEMLTRLRRRARELLDARLVDALADRRRGGSRRQWDRRRAPRRDGG